MICTTEALVDTQVSVFCVEIVAMKTDIAKCMDYMEKEKSNLQTFFSHFNTK